MNQLLGGSAATSLLYAMAELGIADLLDQRPRTAAQLAVLTDTLLDPLERVLRSLAMLGVVRQAPDGTYTLTRVGACLRSSDTESLAPMARLVGTPAIQQAWAGVLQTLRTGLPAFDHVAGIDFATWLKQDPDGAERFHRVMAATTERVAAAVVSSYDFGQLGHVVDVGGGSGVLLRHLLIATPRLRGTIFFDLAHARTPAERAIAVDGLSERCVFVGGDFFQHVPGGADAYLLNCVLRDWDDARCVQLLRVCKEAMRPASRLLIIEGLLPADGQLDPDVVMSDLIMLIMGTGRERSRQEYEVLCQAAGLRIERVLRTDAGPSLLEATL